MDYPFEHGRRYHKYHEGRMSPLVQVSSSRTERIQYILSQMMNKNWNVWMISIGSAGWPMRVEYSFHH